MAEALTYCLGIDGGGTKTEGVLTDLRGRVLARAKTGASNPNDVGFSTSVRLLADMIRDLLREGDVPADRVSAFAGIAGALALRDAMRDAILAEIPTLGALAVDSDFTNLLSAATPSGQGICLICGTGSVCFARDQGQLWRVGGWGYLLDDAGSGYDIGRMALQTALKAYDGRADREAALPLTEALTQHYKKPPHELISDIYANGKPYIASCAPVVFRLAHQGDEICEEILQVNAEALAACITTAHRSLASDATVPVILGGSINVKEAPTWTERIKNALPSSVASSVSLQILDQPPVFGALAEALRAVKAQEMESVFNDYRSVFSSTYLS